MALISVLLMLLAAGVTAVADQCQQVNSDFNTCDVQRICSSCIVTSGCYFSLMDMRCELTASSSAMNASNPSSTSSSTSATTYCSDSHSLCASCTVSAAQPICAGVDGCICPSVCSVVSSSSLDGCGDSSSHSRVLIGFIFMGCAVPAFMFVQVRLTESVVLRGRIMIERERPGPSLRRHRPPRDSSLVPSLETWRQHVEQHKDSLQDVELAACCYVKMDADQPESEAEAESPTSSSGGNVELPLESPASSSGVNGELPAVVQVLTTSERQDDGAGGGSDRSQPRQAAAITSSSTAPAATTVTDQRAVMWIM